MGRLWTLVGVAALLWSLLVAGLWWALENGTQLLFALGRWFGQAPGQMVWLTEALAEAAPAARILLLVLWLAGFALLAAVGLMVARAR